HCHERQRVHRFVDAKTLRVRPSQKRRKSEALSRHFRWTNHRGEFDELCCAGRLKALQQFAERKPDPRNHHRPALDAAMPINTLLEIMWFENVFQEKDARLGAVAVDSNRPRSRLEIPGVFRWIGFVTAEFVEVVEARDRLVRIWRVACGDNFL